MRCLLKSVVVLAVTPVALALPVMPRPSASPHAVTPTVRELSVSGIDATSARSIAGWGAPGPASRRPVALTRAARSATFSALGVTWAAERGLGDVEVLARVRQGGAWSEWHALDADSEHEPDDSHAEARASGLRGGTAPWFSGDADGWQVRLAVASGRAPRDVRVSLVDPGTSAADASAGRSPVLGSSAEAAPAKPGIITRAQWGADERLRSDSPSYGDTILMGFVHHTDTSNSYSTSQAAAMVRSVYAFHTKSRGWSDIGYNFLVDRYGRVFEGRYGGVDRPVIGAHTGGFNTNTFGVALLGNFSSFVPPAATLSALQRTFAWKFSLHQVNPTATTVMTSKGGSKYAAGQQVRLNNVSGHRDAGLTACPGTQTYNRLPTIRSNIKKAMGASLYKPVLSTVAPLFRTTSSVTVKAGTPGVQSWRLLVRNARTGLGYRSLRGVGTASLITAVWDLRDTQGNLVPPDRYELELQSWTSYTQALPYKVRVDVVSPLPSGVVLSRGDGVPYALVDGGRLYGVSAALARALRPQPPLTAYAGPQAALGAPYAGPRDGMYVRNAAGTAWLVVDGVRRPVSSTVASGLSLPAAKTLPDAVLNVAPIGSPWTLTDRHPDGTIVTSPDGAWRIESGARRPFTSPLSKAAWSKSLAVAAAKPYDLALPLGAPLAPPEGVVLKRADGSFVVVSDGAWHPAGTGYTSATLATAEDLAALPMGEPLSATAPPSGTLLKTGTATYAEVLGATRRAVDPALVALDPRVALAPYAGEVAALGGARWTAPSGIAGRDAEGVVRVVDNGRLVTLTPQAAAALGYEAATLPVLEAADFGPLPAGGTITRHPAGTLVTDGTATWLLDAGVRRPVAASLVAAYLGRPALPADAADLALPVGPAAGPPTGAWVATPDGATWLVDGAVRRPVSATVAKRLGLDLVPALPVVLADLTGATVAGTAVG